MKWKSTRIAAGLLALAILLGLTGCSKGGDQNKAELAFQYAPNYIAEDIPLPVDAGALEGCCTNGKTIWFLATPGQDEQSVLCRVPLDGGETEILTKYQAPEGDENTTVSFIGPVMGGDGKLWVWEQFVTREYDLPENFDSETDEKGKYAAGITYAYRMRQLDPATGKELNAVDITAAMEEVSITAFSGVVVDRTGTIYLSGGNTVLAVGGEGQILSSIDAKTAAPLYNGSAGGSLALQPDGSVAVLTTAPNRRMLRYIDPDTRKLEDHTNTLHTGISEIYSGSGQCACYYVYDGILYGVIEGEEIPQRVLPLENTRLENTSSIMCFALMEEGQAAVLICTNESSADWYSGQLQAIRLTPTDEVPEDGRTTLVYGTIGIDVYMSSQIHRFNRGNREYHIEVRDYAEGMLDAAEDRQQAYSSALTRMYAEFTDGRYPDILADTLPLDALAKQGVLEDLWPWIEGDEALGRENVMEHVLECMETNGKLCRVGSSFTIETAVTSAALAGDRTGWTMEEMLDACGGELPALYFGGTMDGGLSSFFRQPTFYRLDRRSILYHLVRTNLESYVDWETGECFFDGEDFKGLLELCASAGTAESGKMAEDEKVRLSGSAVKDADMVEPVQVYPWEGEPMLYPWTIRWPYDLVVHDLLFSGPETLTDFRQLLWDAGVLSHWTSPYNGRDLVSSHVSTSPYKGDSMYASWIGEVEDVLARKEYALDMPFSLAGDFVIGGSNGEISSSFAGFPSPSGSGGSFTVNNCFGISASSKAKEGAWSFVRRALTSGGYELWNEEYNMTWVRALPMNRADFDSFFKTQWCVDVSTGEAFLDGDGEPIPYPCANVALGAPGPIVALVYLMPPTQAQMDRFWAFYNAIDHVTGEDEDLINIILEQAEPYFAGDKNLDETVQLVQNRAKLYVNEHR